jgi:hypothetical protein
MARLTAEFWVQAYLARLRLADIPAFVVARGDATAGAVLVKQATLDGRATAHQRSFDPMTGARRGWCWPKGRNPTWTRRFPARGSSTPTSG